MSTVKPIVLRSRTFYGPITLGRTHATITSLGRETMRATRGAVRRLLATKRVTKFTYYYDSVWGGWRQSYRFGVWSGSGDRRALKVGCHRFSGKNLATLRKWARKAS